MDECIFCKIAKHEISAQVVYEDEEVVAFRDVNPVAPVHILVIPKEHVPGVGSLAEEHKDLLAHIVMVIKKLAQENPAAADGFRIVINVGKRAGQSVPHLHLHVLAGRELSWPPG